ncbi:nuclear transport factor 2 family protein [Actinoplanes auranticolor]|uniref:SnoaL-like domain-containing protein n=1 Tax=Actinoplanes auranticolor TaxID=47988 RepID=A0A919VXI7_9ACTN|nr:nuclear transport factor 2 family protein [Actinoplanes auranticolor]GIM80741.1 hypothetical protein Aau02nite_91890 [Actinoplanes auranticolor]
MPDTTELSDRAELIALVSRLGRWLDNGSDKEGHTIYHRDAVIRSPRGTASGIAEIIDYVDRTSDDAERTQHLTTDILVALDGDRAELTANMLVTFFSPESNQLAPALRLVGLQSAFSALRTSQGWRLIRADVTPLWQRLS